MTEEQPEREPVPVYFVDPAERAALDTGPGRALLTVGRVAVAVAWTALVLAVGVCAVGVLVYLAALAVGLA